MTLDDRPEESVLFLSPHLDDVVWSCPTAVLRSVAGGARAVVATVFTSSDAGAGERERKLEDRSAVELLGGEAQHLDLVDAPWRTPWWDTDECEFDDLVCGPLNAELVHDVRDAALRVCDELRPKRIVAPLGVGLHIDHRTVHSAVLEVAAATGSVIEFYEDRPYSFVDQSVSARLHHLGVAAPVDWDAHWASFDDALYVRTFLGDGGARQRIAEHMERAEPMSTRHHATPIDVDVTSEESVVVRRAMNSYGSQVGAFLDEGLLARCGSERRWKLE